MSRENPWKKRGTRIVYRNPWITLREDAVQNPDGSGGIYGFLETRVATGVVALTEDMEIVLVGQYRYPTEEYSWEIPEGGADLDEDPLSAAKRELREEAGVVASRWEPLGGEIHLSNCISSERGHLFLARDLRLVPAEPESTEILLVRRMPFSECLTMLDRGEIRDSLTIIGVLRAARLLGIA